MHLEQSIDIAATPEKVWRVMADVTRWHEWTATVTSVELLDPGELHVGQRAELKQPQIPKAIWRVTDVQPGRGFTWRSNMLGMDVVARHVIEPRGRGSTVTLLIDASGVAAALLRPVAQSRMQRAMRTEAEGLKRRAETGA